MHLFKKYREALKVGIHHVSTSPKSLPNSVLCVIALLSMQASGLSANENNTDQSATESQPLYVQLLHTGETASDTLSYWDCATANETETFEDIHLRFWKDSTGFSAISEFTWQSDNFTPSIQITYELGTTVLTDIAFSTTRHDNDWFTATDGAGDNIACSWVGPIRNSQAEALYSDEIPRQTVSDDISTGANKTWFCSSNTDPSFQPLKLQFLSENIATINNQEGSWFVDDRFKVVVSYESQVFFLSKISVNSDRTQLSSKLNNTDLACQKQDL